MSKASPTQRTLALLKKQGAIAQVVERWNSHARVRHDLFGIIDVLAIRDGRYVGIQACAGASFSARDAKIRASEHYAAILEAGGLELWAWRQVWGHDARGARRRLWKPKIKIYGSEDQQRKASE
ncbi:MAG: hypothetical protein B7733_08485 [Myxococcales bacterium FL481]|nr:MAG: hypothetical protein B7733_08485 [Myxococcales bacterium FL481]